MSDGELIQSLMLGSRLLDLGSRNFNNVGSAVEMGLVAHQCLVLLLIAGHPSDIRGRRVRVEPCWAAC